jgi:hypothetical protein
MLKTRRDVFALSGSAISALVASSAKARSQRRSRQDQQQPTQQPQQNPVTDQRGSEQSPLVVRVIPTSADQTNAAQEEKDRQEKADLDRKLVDFNGDLAYYTKCLVAFAGLQFFAMLLQAYWLGRTVKISERAADAAKESADAVVSQLRAYIHVSLLESPTIDDERVLKATVQVKNTGQTPAYDAVIVSNIGIVSWPPPRPLETIFVDTDAPTVVRISLPSGEASANIPEIPSVSAREEAGLKSGAYRIVVWGRVNYMDAFKKPRATRYAFSLRWEGDKFGLPFYEAVGNSAD